MHGCSYGCGDCRMVLGTLRGARVCTGKYGHRELNMAARMIVFDMEALRALLVHYSEGGIPLASEVVRFEVSPKLQRYLSITIQSSEWEAEDHALANGELEPYHFRYEGNRVMKLNRLADEGHGAWTDPYAVEAPKRQ